MKSYPNAPEGWHLLLGEILDLPLVVPTTGPFPTVQSHHTGRLHTGTPRSYPDRGHHALGFYTRALTLQRPPRSGTPSSPPKCIMGSYHLKDGYATVGKHLAVTQEEYLVLEY